MVAISTSVVIFIFVAHHQENKDDKDDKPVTLADTLTASPEKK